MIKILLLLIEKILIIFIAILLKFSNSCIFTHKYNGNTLILRANFVLN